MNGMYSSCPICSGKFSAQDVFEFASPKLDNKLCGKHLREQLKMRRVKSIDQ